MLLVQLKEMKNFTNHEKDVANYILTHKDEIPDISAGELAEASLTSKATVVRLSQKLGLSGYQELKLKLIAEVNQNERIGQILANEPITPQSSYSDIIHTIPGLYDKAVPNTRLTLNKTDMLRINHFLQEAECIVSMVRASAIHWHRLRRLSLQRSARRARPMRASTVTILPLESTKRRSPSSSALREPIARWKPWPSICAQPRTTMWLAFWDRTTREPAHGVMRS